MKIRGIKIRDREAAMLCCSVNLDCDQKIASSIPVPNISLLALTPKTAGEMAVCLMREQDGIYEDLISSVVDSK